MSDPVIFIVDDDQILNDIHSIIIKKLYPSIQVHTFTQISEAINSLHSYKVPEILFLDLHIPGDDIARLLDVQKSLNLSFAVHLISSLAYLYDRSLLEKYPSIKGFIPKPLEKEKLKLIINEYA